MANYYTVLDGWKTGIFIKWEECRSAIEGFPDARYYVYPSLEKAQAALDEFAMKNPGVTSMNHEPLCKKDLFFSKYGKGSIVVGVLEDSNSNALVYYGIDALTGDAIFEEGPFQGLKPEPGLLLAVVSALKTIWGTEETAHVYCKDPEIISQLLQRNLKDFEDWISQAMKDSNSLHIGDKLIHSMQWLAQYQPTITLGNWNEKEWGPISTLQTNKFKGLKHSKRNSKQITSW